MVIPLRSVFHSSETRGSARDRDDAGARNVNQAQRLHQVNESVELFRRSRHLEHEALDRRIYHACTKNVGKPERLDTSLAGARHLDEREFAFDMRSLIGEVAHGVDWHKARKLRFDLLD